MSNPIANINNLIVNINNPIVNINNPPSLLDHCVNYCTSRTEHPMAIEN